MTSFENMQMARNETENYVNCLQKSLDLSEFEMALVLEMVLSNARQKALIRNSYDKASAELEKAKTENAKEDSDNGDSDEAR